MNSELLKNKDLDVYYIMKLVPKYQYSHFVLIQALEEADLDASTLPGRRLAVAIPTETFNAKLFRSHYGREPAVLGLGPGKAMCACRDWRWGKSSGGVGERRLELF